MAEAKKIHRHMLPTGVLGMGLRADGRTLCAACMDGVYELNTETGEFRKLYAHESYASGAAVFDEVGLMVSGSYDGTLIWWDLAAGKQIHTVKAHQFWSWQLARSPDGKYVASATGQYLSGGPKYEPAPEREPSVRIYDVATGALVQSLSHVPSVQSVAFSPDSKYVAAGNLMGEVRLWEVATGKQVGTVKTDAFTTWGIIKSHCYIGGVFALAFTPSGEELILGGMGPMVDPMAGNGKQTWQRFTWRGEPKMTDEIHAGDHGEGLMEAIALHPAVSCFALSGRLRGGNWNTALFSLADGKQLASWKTDSRVTGAVFTRDGKRLILGGARPQPGFKDGKVADFGHVDVYEVSV